jgi:hypothetical protein
MTDVDPLDETLELARAVLAPSVVEDARLRRALGLAPNGSPSPAAEPSAAAERGGLLGPRAWRALRASGSAGILVGAVLAGVGFGAGLWLGRAELRVAPQPLGGPPASEVPSDTPAAGAALPASLEPATPVPHEAVSEPPEPSRPPPEPSPHREARAARSAPSRAHAASSAAAAELALLRRVERALRAQNPALALALLAELDQRFPDTRLAEERDAAHVIAACGVGEGGARLRAERFLREHGASVYAERVREACSIAAQPARGEGSASPGDQ